MPPVPAAAPRTTTAPIPVRHLLPWTVFALLLGAILIYFVAAEGGRERERDEPGQDAGQHAAHQQDAGHDRAQWQGKPSRCRPSWVSSCTNVPSVSDVTPPSAATK